MTDSVFIVGDYVRLVVSTCAAQEGEEGCVCRVESDHDGNIVALDILIDADPTRTRGTTVFVHEIERVDKRA